MATTEKTSETSELYLACKNDDVIFVKEHLAKLSDSKSNPNHLEPSVKNTPLHAASCYGHKEIVKLLIEHGCDRSQVNGYGLTAYEIAANDDIRQVFHRPTDDSGMHRFIDESTDDCFDFVKRPKRNTEEAATPATERQCETKKIPTVQGYKTDAEKHVEVGYSTTSIAMCQSKLGRFIANRFHRGTPLSVESMAHRLQEVIDKEITGNNDPQSQKANDLLKKFLNDTDNGCIEYLIRLYTLQTKFYYALRQDPMPLALPLYRTLQQLKDRYFQGRSYRGARMDDEDVATYEWAVENRGSLLQTRHFFSTSMVRSVSEQFATGANSNGDSTRRNSVLFIFNFSKKCDQAINLSRISDEQPCLSEFENEAEVLILPWTLFQVDSVEKESSSLSYTISLTNVLLPHRNMLSSLKWIATHPKGSINRFHEHFPEKQPENVVRQLMESCSLSAKSIPEEFDQ